MANEGFTPKRADGAWIPSSRHSMCESAGKPRRSPNLRESTDDDDLASFVDVSLAEDKDIPSDVIHTPVRPAAAAANGAASYIPVATPVPTTPSAASASAPSARSTPVAYPIAQSPNQLTGSHRSSGGSRATVAVAAPLARAMNDDSHGAERPDARSRRRPSSVPIARSLGVAADRADVRATSRTPPPRGLGANTTFMHSTSTSQQQMRLRASDDAALLAGQTGAMYHSNQAISAKEAKAIHVRAKKVTDGMNQVVSIIPSSSILGLYRIQEHSHNAVPVATAIKRQYVELKLRIQGTCFDAEYAESTIDSMRTINTFSNVQHQLNRAIHLKEMLDKKERHR